jgi:LAT3 family solute carrier family 43 protein 3
MSVTGVRARDNTLDDFDPDAAVAPVDEDEDIIIEGDDVVEPDIEKDPHLVDKSGDGRARRWILFTYAFVTACLVAGTVYGWPHLRLQLKREGSTLTETELGAIYTAGTWSSQGGLFFTGLARDQYGTRLVACVTLVCTFVGAFGIAFSDPSNGIALGISLFVMSLGSGSYMVMLPVGSLFPGCSNAIVSSLSGAFQVSGLVFMVLTNISASSDAITSTTNAFVGYATVVACLALIAWWLLPAGGSFHLAEDDQNIKEESRPTSDNESSSDNNDDEGDCEDGEEINPAMQDNQLMMSKRQQIVSLEYIGLLLWFSICLIPLQYYVGSLGFQLENKGDDDGTYTNLFAIVFSAAAVVAPLGGYISDIIGLGLTQGLATVLTASAFFILASDAISLKGQVAGLVCYGVGRMFIFGMFYSNIGLRFGYTNFGTLSGIGLLVSALASLLQYPLILAASNGSAALINNVSGIVFLCLTPYCAWLAYEERQQPRAQSLLKRNDGSKAKTLVQRDY